MWRYEKRLQYPVNIKEPNAKIAKYIMSQYGGPDGEIGASMRYLSQRYAMPYGEQKAVLTDIGTEELAHLEIVAAIVHQLTRNLSAEDVRCVNLSNPLPRETPQNPWKTFRNLFYSQRYCCGSFYS